MLLQVYILKHNTTFLNYDINYSQLLKGILKKNITNTIKMINVHDQRDWYHL